MKHNKSSIHHFISSSIHQINKFFKQQDQLNLLIIINLLLYLFTQILIALKWFSLIWVALPYDWNILVSKWWTALTYGLFHQGFIALLFNMLLLYYFGRILLDFDSPKKFWGIYFSGILLGAVFFLASYQLFPDFYVIKAPLLGASAGVMAVITYISMKLPHYQIKIRFLGFFKLMHILIFLVLFNLLQIPLGNPGGYFAHLGGLSAGFIFFLINLKQKEKAIKKPSIFSITKSKKERKLDDILDKISRSGYESLTDEEKEELFKQSKK